MSERLTDQQLGILWEQWNLAAVELISRARRPCGEAGGSAKRSTSLGLIVGRTIIATRTVADLRKLD